MGKVAVEELLSHMGGSFYCVSVKEITIQTDQLFPINNNFEISEIQFLLTPKRFGYALFQQYLGGTEASREIKNNAYVKI